MRNKKLIVIFSVICAFALVSVLTSVLFSVRYVNAYCFNGTDEALENTVIENCGIELGASIFLLDKNEVSALLEAEIPNIDIVNIEKKFPNRVYINYVKIDEYYKIVSGGKIYCITNSGIITRVLDETDTSADGLIPIITKGKVSAAEGEALRTDNATDSVIISIIFPALERLLHREELLQFFEFVDITKGFIYFKTRSGVCWELQSVENALDKMLNALSVYIAFGSESEQVKKGTMILTWRAGEANTDYNSKDRYTDGV